MDHGGSTKPSATREIDLSLTLTVDFDQFRASVQVKKETFSLVAMGLSTISHAFYCLKLLNGTKPS